MAATETDTSRFAFGENWLAYAKGIDERRIQSAERSLAAALGEESLAGTTFLDAGCGSGLFSLAAVRLGAGHIVSFDFDPDAVVCAEALRERFAPGSAEWKIQRGDLLDEGWMASLGSFDVVYCWGVLHHTGQMWTALEHLIHTVAPGGRLYLSVYNDQGFRSKLWREVKWFSNQLPSHLRPAFAALAVAPAEALSALEYALNRNPGEYLSSWTDRDRGMSKWHDVLDWVGGYPFETAKPERVFAACRAHGLELVHLVTCRGSSGANEFVFRRPAG